MSDSTPLFIVGLPRSGSTLLSKILNDGKTYFSINDLYYVQAVHAVDAMKGFLSGEDVKTLTGKLLEVVETRALKNNAFIGQFSFNPDQIQDVREYALLQHKVRPYTWDTLLNDVLTRLAGHLNKRSWADKTPQNFMHLDTLRESFPNCIILYLFRDPRSTLVSLKHAAGPGHDPRRYHPIAYALYWRAAVRSYLSARDRMDEVCVIRYEDILSDPEEMVKSLNLWTDAQIDEIRTDSGHNSSFGAKKRRQLNSTEQWICQKICKTEMKELGYSEEYARIRLKDIPEFFYLSVRFVLFQAYRVLFSKDGRARITNLIRQIFYKRGV